ncbi:hypothetical protein [Telluribacter humicola]
MNNDQLGVKNIFRKMDEKGPENHDFWFPGRYIGGISTTIAPIVLLIGVLLRMPFHFFFPQQLAAFNDHPTLMVTSYNFFVVGNILLWPAIITLSREIGKKRSQLALWGGTFVLFGLFARTFHGGVDHLSFQLVRIEGLENATKIVADSYGAFSIIATLNGAILAGWIILSIGAFLSNTLGIIRSVALGLMSMLMLGVLKGSSWGSVVAVTGLCVALIPLGIKVLKEGPRPSYKSMIVWSLIITVIIASLYFIGQQG